MRVLNSLINPLNVPLDSWRHCQLCLSLATTPGLPAAQVPMSAGPSSPSPSEATAGLGSISSQPCHTTGPPLSLASAHPHPQRDFWCQDWVCSCAFSVLLLVGWGDRMGYRPCLEKAHGSPHCSQSLGSLSTSVFSPTLFTKIIKKNI